MKPSANQHFAPANTQKLIDELTVFAKQLYKVRKDVTEKLATSKSESPDEGEYLETILQKITQLQKNASNTIQESYVKTQNLQSALRLIENDLSIDSSKWIYWKSNCPICLRKIRIDSDSNVDSFQTVPCCYNLFHSSCLNAHFKSSNSASKSCPLCRKTDIDWHPFYKHGTNTTPDKFKHTFETMTHKAFNNNFDHLGNSKFREAFQHWSNFKTQSIKEQVEDLVDQKLLEFKAQLKMD
jgi:hypothetical protein